MQVAIGFRLVEHFDKSFSEQYLIVVFVVRDFKDDFFDLYAIVVHRARWEVYQGND